MSKSKGMFLLITAATSGLQWLFVWLPRESGRSDVIGLSFMIATVFTIVNIYYGLRLLDYSQKASRYATAVLSLVCAIALIFEDARAITAFLHDVFGVMTLIFATFIASSPANSPPEKAQS